MSRKVLIFVKQILLKNEANRPPSVFILFLQQAT